MSPKAPLVFGCCVGAQRFRVDGARVVGVCLRTRMRASSGTGAWTHVVRRHGAWVPMMDLRLHFGLDHVRPSLFDHFVFVEVEGVVVGLVVDRVVELRAGTESSDHADAPLQLKRWVDLTSARSCIAAHDQEGAA